MHFAGLTLSTQSTFVHREYKFHRGADDSDQSYQSSMCQSPSQEAISVHVSAFSLQLFLQQRCPPPSLHACTF